MPRLPPLVCARSRLSRAAPVAATLVVALVLLLCPAGARAQGLSYTVQVVAVSDQEAALGVQRTLLDQSFPAYVVRAGVAQGDIFRVRVGAFANRGAALALANEMTAIAGSQPLPALAEGIPAGLMPLVPRLLAQSPGEGADLIAWGEDGIGLRVHADPARPADYHVFDGAESRTFRAWRAEPTEDGAILTDNLSLWPEEWEERSPEELEEFRVAMLAELAEELSTTPEELERLQFRPVFGPPYLVVVELLPPQPFTPTRVVGVTAAGEEPTGTGPDQVALGDWPLPEEHAPIFVPTAESERLVEVVGDEWTVTTDGRFFRLTGSDGGSAWRAGVGDLLWSDGRYLLTRSRERLMLYDFTPR